MSFYGLEKTNAHGKSIKFNIKDMDIALINSIRRIITHEIPNVAINFDLNDYTNSDITIHKNTCSLHNEFLAHRISFIPLCFYQDEIETYDPKKYKFVLKKKNYTPETILVASKDFEIYDYNGKKYPDSFRERIFPKCGITGDYILITKLKPNLYDIQNGEEVDIECLASINTATTNSRWCPVSQCSYGNAIDNDAASIGLKEKINKIENDSGKQLTEKQKNSITQQFYVKDAYRFFKKNMYDEPSEVEFMIETECALSPEYLFGKALDVLKTKINGFINKLSDYEIIKLPQAPNFFELHITDESYTLINLLQSLIYNVYFRQTIDGNVLDSISYYKTHPLDNMMILKIKFINSLNEKNMNDYLKLFLEQNCKNIIETIDKYVLEWQTFVGES